MAINALMAARASAPHLDDLAHRWIGRMPRMPLSSQNIRTICRDPGSGPLLLDAAIDCPWVALNTRQGLNALVLDIDHDDALDVRREIAALGGPVPDLVIDPWSGRAHAVQWLVDPVPTGDDPRYEGSMRTASFAGRLMAAAWRATLLPQVSLVKSPWGRVSLLTGKRLKRGSHPSVPARWEAYQENQNAGSDLMWITIPGTGPAKLLDIIGTLAPGFEFDAAPSTPSVRMRKNRGMPDGRGRNCELFDLVRWWAYDHHETSTEAILAEATRVNDSGIFTTPLPMKEVHGVARSIGRFMRDRYRPRHGSDARRGRDRDLAHLDLDVHGRQAAAGRRTAANRSAATDARLAAAVAALLASGAPLTQKAIAAHAGVGISTVERRWRPQTDPSNAVLSVSAAFAAPSKASFQGFSSLSSLVAHGLLVRETLKLLVDLIKDVRRPGAEPKLIPELHPSVAEEPTVRMALRQARDAMDDARRRVRARQAKAAVLARRVTMEELLRADPSMAWKWFRGKLEDLEAGWDLMEAAVEGEPSELASVRNRREYVFMGLWRSWKAARAAVRAARQSILPNRPDALDMEIPW